jgi:putative FmdB family regulatory protein
MPIYEYRCDACGHELDALQKLSDDPLRDCPECSAAALRRLMSAPSFRLKGSGWYETDFKSDKETKRNLAGGGESKDAKASVSGNKDSAEKDSSKNEKSTAGDAKKDSATSKGAAAKKDSSASAI